MKKTTVAHFSVTGEFITQHARARLLEGTWRSALNFLQTSLPGFGRERSMSLLNGDAELQGINELDYKVEP